MQKKIKLLLSGFILIMILFTGLGCSDTEKEETSINTPISESYFIFDTLVTIRVYDETVTATHFEEMEEILEQIDSLMNRNRAGSDIYLINQQAGEEGFVTVSQKTYDVVEKALQYAKMTNGTFEPTVGPLVDLWSVTIEGASLPEEQYIEEATQKVGYQDVQLHATDLAIRLARPKMSLDLGGIAKGYAGDLVAQYLINAGFEHAIIDLGGDIVTLGQRPNGQDWKIGIQEPESNQGDYIGILQVNNKTVLTSGIYERYFIQDGVRYHHIFDPDTGYPVQNELSSVTIVSDTAIDADALATAVFAFGLDKGLQFVEEMEEMEAIFITQENQIYLTSALHHQLELTNSKYTINKYTN